MNLTQRARTATRGRRSELQPIRRTLPVPVSLVPWEVAVLIYPQSNVRWWKWKVEARMRQAANEMAGVWLLCDGLVRYLHSLEQFHSLIASLLLPSLRRFSQLGHIWTPCTPFNPVIYRHFFHALAHTRTTADFPGHAWFPRP
jgi:hypothetical protein